MSDLSPGAQAVVNAICIPPESSLYLVAVGFSAVAILAATDHVLPGRYSYASQDLGLVRDELLSIAEDLARLGASSRSTESPLPSP